MAALTIESRRQKNTFSAESDSDPKAEKMTSTSEGIILLVPHVKLKKNEGELYLMTERLGWMVGNKDSFSVTHKYSDIKSKFC